MRKSSPAQKPVDIADLRRRLGSAEGPASQAELAQMCGTHQTTICRWESDPSVQRGPLLILLRKLDTEAAEPRRRKAA